MAQRGRGPRAGAASVTAFALAALLFLTPGLALAQAVPGNAPGSQTGDGGGSYAGLAASPEANLFTGTAQTSIPIVVPPGRLGLAPVLALSYSSTAGASAYGYGWDLALPRIHRSAKKGVPRYDDGDVFVLEMPGGAVELERTPGSLRGFRARVESAFLRVGFHETDNTWTVIDKLGMTFVFGGHALTRTGRGFSRNETFGWLLERIEDPAGNSIDFEYRPDPTGAVATPLPERIRYGANARAGAGHFAEVRFVWEPLSYPTTTRVSLREGYEDRLELRLAAIETSTKGLAARRYDFSHDIDPVSGDARLVGATLTAFAGRSEDDVQLPSTVFLYARATSSGWPTASVPTPVDGSFTVPKIGPLREGTKNILVDTLDIDGDAVVDYVDAKSWPPKVRPGNRRGFGEPRSWNWPEVLNAPRAIRRTNGDGDLESNVFDLDGDGYADLVYGRAEACAAPAGNWCVWRGSVGGFADQPLAWPSPVDVLRRAGGGGARVESDLVDVDADGRPDLIDTAGYDADDSPSWRLYRNTGDGFATSFVPFPAPMPFLANSSGTRQVYGLLDLNADTLPDLVDAGSWDGIALPRWDQTPQWRVYLGNGSGLASLPVAWGIEGGEAQLPNFIALRAGDGSTLADVFDLTGDGRPDLVRRNWGDESRTGIRAECTGASRCLPLTRDAPATSPAWCCFNLLLYVNTGASFADPIGWTSPTHGLRSSLASCPSTSTSCGSTLIFDFDFFDFDGDGLVDLIERDGPLDANGTWRIHPHPASAAVGRTRPNLLRAMRNGIGGETVLRYDVAASMPESRLPFPHWVVVERELRDSVFDPPPLRTSFAYRGGSFDPVEREMRGFAVVQEVDPIGVSRVREYHQDHRRAGRLHRLSVLSPPPCEAATPDDPADPCSPWQFVRGVTDYEWTSEGAVLLEAETVAPFHRGNPVENLRKSVLYAHDEYGNVTMRETATPLAITTTTSTRYVHRVSDEPGGMPVTYSVAKPSQVWTDEAERVPPLVERRFDYQWQGPAVGALASASTCVSWKQRECERWSTRSFGYDAFGNVVVARAGDGAASRTTYDADGRFAVASTDPVGLVTSATIDPRTGLPTETIAPNGNRLASRFDGLGRLLRTWGPGTSEADPLRSVAYAPGGLGASPPRMVQVEPGAGASATFFDGLGRVAATKAASQHGERRVSRISGLRVVDDRGLVTLEALPFDSEDLDLDRLVETFDDAPAWLEYEHDADGRRSATRSPDGAVVRTDESAPGIRRVDDANFTRPARRGSVTLEISDGLGRRIQREVCTAAPDAARPYECSDDAIEHRETWIHDGLGRVTEARNAGLGIAAGDAVTRIAYDGLGNRSSLFHSDAGTWTFEHDQAGRLTEVHKPDGTTLTTTYDAAGRIERRRGPTSSAGYRYWRSGSGIGKVRRVSSRSGRARLARSFDYDARGRLVTRRSRVSVTGGFPARLLTRYQYDDRDRRVAIEFPDWGAEDERVLRSEFDERGRVVRVSSGAFDLVRRVVRDSAGRPLRLDHGNGVSDLVEYEEPDNSLRQAGYLRCLRTTASEAAEDGACGSSPLDLDSLHYADYDPAGNLRVVEDRLHDATDPAYDARAYTYDAIGRLASATYGDSTRDRFAFDPLGNLTRKGDDRLVFSEVEHPSRLSGLTGPRGADTTVEHDVNGRRTRDGERRYFWDDSDRLSAVEAHGETVVEYGYDDSGARLYALDPRTGSVRFEMGDGITIEGSRVERAVSLGDRVVVVEQRDLDRLPGSTSNRPTKRIFLHSDHQRSIRMVTDREGRVVERRRYGAFGETRVRLDDDGHPIAPSSVRFGYTGHDEDAEAGLLFFGARHYDPSTGSFLSLDPAMQFASPYAYSGGNPVGGRDADGRLYELTALEIVAVLAGTAAFVDSLVTTGDLGGSLTAGVFAGASVFASHQLSTMVAKSLTGIGSPWMKMAAAVASDGFQAGQAVKAFDEGRYAGGVVAAGMLAASLIGIETAEDPGPGSTPEEKNVRSGIVDRGKADGTQVLDVNGVCSTRPGCFSNILTAARENLRALFGNRVACVGGCEQVVTEASNALRRGDNVLLRCNSFGAIKCLGALNDPRLTNQVNGTPVSTVDGLKVEMSGAPLLRPPAIGGVTYQVNTFDPVVWVGAAYATPFRSDVVLGRNWWVPAPVLVHHSRMYEKPFFEALDEIVP